MRATDKQLEFLSKLFERKGFTREQRKALLEADYESSNIEDLNVADASKLIDYLKDDE